MLDNLKLHADVCRTNAKMADRDGCSGEAEQWERAARLIDCAIIRIKLAAERPAAV